MRTQGYPHPGLRLAPELLKEILRVPIPELCVEQDRPNGLLCDLDETAWITFTPKQCLTFAQMIVGEVRRQLHPNNPVLALHLPKIADGIKASDLELGLRGQNCLKQLLRARSIEKLSGLANLTLRDVLSTKALGVRTLLELLTVLEAASSRLEQPKDEIVQLSSPEFVSLNEQLTREAAKILEMPASKVIRLNDVTLAKHLGVMLAAVSNLNREKFLTRWSTLEDVATLLVSRESDPQESEDLADQLLKLRSKIGRMSNYFLETELEKVVATIAPSRAVPIILTRHGWNGQEPSTLQATGEKFRITRERVRQIVNAFDKQLARRKPFLPVLRKALEFLSTSSKTSAREIEAALVTQRITEKPFAVEAIVSASELVELPIPFRVQNLKGQKCLLRQNLSKICAIINAVAKGNVAHWGVATLEDVFAQVKDKCEIPIDFELVAKILRDKEDFVELDRSKGWFWLSSIHATHLIRNIRKVLAVSAKVSVSELRGVLAKHERFRGFSPPRRVLLELCRHLPFCSTDNDNVIRTQELSLEKELSDSELRILALLERTGPVVEWAKFRDACVASGMNMATFTKAFLNSPIFSKCAPRLYCITGAEIPPGLVEELSARRPYSKVLKSFGWLGHQRLWVSYQLSEGLVKGGTATIPSALRSFIHGEFKLKDEENSFFGTLIARNGQAWGLGPFFRRRGGDAGDFLCLNFDLASHEVQLLMGDETVVYPEDDKVIVPPVSLQTAETA